MITTLDFAPGASPEEIGEKVLAAWPRSKVVHIRGPKPEVDLREFYWSFFGKIGEPLPIAEDVSQGDRESQRTGGYWFEVRYEPSSRDAYRHSAEAQPLHTDMSYIPIPNSVGFLGCVAMPDTGGATTFIDSVDVVAALEAEAPDLLRRLEEMDMPHARSGDRREERVVRWVGEKPLLNWNYYCVDPSVDSRAHDMRDRFFEFLRRSRLIADRTARVKMAPGDAVLWKDEEVLHGRDSFNANVPSERYLWKSALLIDA